MQNMQNTYRFITVSPRRSSMVPIVRSTGTAEGRDQPRILTRGDRALATKNDLDTSQKTKMQSPLMKQ